jgi:hypothetical protein
MSKYVKVEDVVGLINGLDSLPFEEETEDVVNSLPIYDIERVVAELEFLKHPFELNEYNSKEKVVNRAIDIVRKGGTEND